MQFSLSLKQHIFEVSIFLAKNQMHTVFHDQIGQVDYQNKKLSLFLLDLRG